jgi:hypothetical protein
LRTDGGQQNAVEDYGVARARLWVSPLLSGLTALGGVVLVYYLPSAIAALMQGTAAQLPFGAGAAQNAPVTPTLNQIFSLQTNAAILVPAAVFGFAPNVFLNVLRTTANRYEAALSSTGATANKDVQSSKTPSGVRGRLGTLVGGKPTP